MLKDSALEKTIEDSCNRRALKLGIRHRKMNGIGNNDWPDQLYFSPNFRKEVKGVFIEWKRKGNEPTENQYNMMQLLETCGFDVMWCDDAEEGLAYLKTFLKARK